MNLDEVSPLAWIVNNGFKSENQKPIEFTKHRFLIRPMTDLHPDQVVRKSAQVGYSVTANFKSFWLLKFRQFNIIYVLPTANVIKDFVQPKVDPLIVSNPEIQKMITVDSVSLKQIGDRFIYFKGSYSQREAISVSADLLVIDEYDRCISMEVLNTYDSRLQASEYGWRWRFSNPSVPNFGVDKLFKESDQHFWVIKHSCGHNRRIEFETNPEKKTHYVDIERKVYACGKCHGDISDKERTNGKWVARYPERTADGGGRRGYHIDQMMAPWVSAEKILKQKEESSPEFFYNFVLGLPYQSSELIVDREAILRVTTPMQLAKTNVIMGVDNGVEKHWVLGTPSGIFAYGKTESWEEIETMIRMYNATCVIDANPYPNIPKALTKQYRGRVFVNFYIQDSKNLGVVRWGEGDEFGVVKSDRTQIIDRVASDIALGNIRFATNPREMENYIYHWEQMRRTNETNTQGITKGVWLTTEGKPDHWAHATVYWRIALEKSLVPSGGGVMPNPPAAPSKGLLVDPETRTFRANIDLKKIAEDSERR